MQRHRTAATALLFGLAMLLPSCRGPAPPAAEVERWAGKGVLCADLDDDGLDEIVSWASQEREATVRVYDADRGVPRQAYTLTTPAPLTAVVAARLARDRAPALVLCHGSRVTLVQHDSGAYVDSDACDAGALIRSAAALDADADDADEVVLLTGGIDEDGALRGASLRVFAWRQSALEPEPAGLDAVSHPAAFTPVPVWPGESARLLVWRQTFRAFEPSRVASPVVFGAMAGGLMPLWEGPETPRSPDQCLFADLDGDGGLEMLAAQPLTGGGHLLRCYNATGGRLEDPRDAVEPVGLLSPLAAVQFDKDRGQEIAFADSPKAGVAELTVRKWNEGQLDSLWSGDVSEAACSVAVGNILRGEVGAGPAARRERPQELVCLDGSDLVIVSHKDDEISMTRH